jgi:WD40-like Beta Propeller Repeat
VKDAETRTWETVKRAYEDRSPRPSRRRLRNSLLLAALAAALAAAVLSPPGRAVFERVREAVGVQHAAPALFSLPASGRLLVVSAERGGVWLVYANGLKRRIGSYQDAEWSPHGLYVIATRTNELMAVSPDGAIRWSLARRDVRYPTWEGTRTDTRIAYIADSGLRVVAGDGTGDHLVDRYAQSVPPAWDPARLHVLAYFTGGSIVLRAASGPIVWRAPVTVLPTSLEWSSDGRELAVVSAKRIVVLNSNGRVERTISMLGAEFLQAAFRPGSHKLAVAVRLNGHSEVKLVDVDHPGTSKLLFAGPGDFGDVAWSPDGNWLLVTWPTANQWVFLHGSHVQAVGNIREQFPRADHLGPVLELSGRWCCSS